MELKEKIEYQLKHHVGLLKVINMVMSSALRLWGMFVPMDRKMVLFSALGRRYNDSPKAIYEYMLTLPDFEDYKMVWALENPDSRQAMVETLCQLKNELNQTSTI